MGRRHLTTAITLLVLCGILALGFVVGYRELFAPIPDDTAADTPAASPSPSCTTEPVQQGERIRSRDVQVSVFNAGQRAGLANETMGKLTHRGFKRGRVGNAPDGAKLRFVQVWTTDKHDAEARLVARQFGTHTLIKVTDQDLGPGIDVLVGNDFRGLRKAKRSLVVHRPQRVCTPADTASAQG